MGCWRVVGKGWRYQFQFKGHRYSGAWFQTKAEAREKEIDHRKRLKAEKTPTGTASESGFIEIANEYLDYSQRRFSDKNYRGKIYSFKKFQETYGNPNFRNITGRDLENHLARFARNSNYNRHRKALCALFAWAFKRGLIAINPCVYVSNMPHQPAQKKIPSQEEMARIIMAAGEQRPFFLALFGLAARLGEINNLKWEDVNFEKREVTLWTKKGDGTPRKQIKHLNEELYGELQRLWNKRSGTWVFPNPRTGQPYKNRRWQIRQSCLNARVPYYSWHCIRHHVASLLADTHKESIPTIQKMLGHASPQTTFRYVQSLGQDVVEAAEKLKTTHNTYSQDLENEVK